jgi:soluble lytic murein transglycosylase
VFDFNTDPAAERAEAEAWLRTHFVVDGPAPLSSLDPELAADPRVIRGREMWRLGLLSEGRDELEALREAVSTDAEATYRLMHTLLELRLYRSAIFAARQILTLAGMDDGQALTAPVYFNRIRFGPYFGELILPAAIRYQLDGLFVLSVVRQESLFEGFAISYAGARTVQVIRARAPASPSRSAGRPATLRAISTAAGEPSSSARSTWRSEARTLRRRPVAALAAYNAGGNSLIWKERRRTTRTCSWRSSA